MLRFKDTDKSSHGLGWTHMGSEELTDRPERRRGRRNCEIEIGKGTVAAESFEIEPLTCE